MKKKFYLIASFLLLASVGLAQNEVSGIVTDQESEPLFGVSVMVKGTAKSVVTDERGYYSISVKEHDLLVFSFVGMVTQEVLYKGQSVVNLKMLSDMFNLEDVVVVGYGTTKKSDLTGAIVSINTNDLKNTKTGLLGNALQGLAAGVQVSQNNLKPGGGVSIVVRGRGSVNAGNSPLVLVDGIPGSLSEISPSDIESIEILKDASAASIYGNRGSNGVILITTKQGVAGKTRVSFNAQGGVMNMVNKMNMMTSQQYYDLITSESIEYTWKRDELLQLSRGETTDWQNAISEQGQFNNLNFSISGGNEKSTNYLGVDYYNMDGVIKNSNFDRVTVRYNNDTKLTDWASTGVRLNVVRSKIRNVNEESDELYGTLFSAVSAQPTAPVYGANGEYFDGFLNTKANPVAIVDLLDKSTTQTRTSGVFFVEFKPIEHLTFRMNNAGILNHSLTNEYEDPRMGQHYAAEGVANISNSNSTYLQTENTITYENEFGKHKLKSMAGFSASKSQSENSFALSKGIDPITKFHNLGGGSEFGPNSSYAAASTLASIYTRINYNYNDRYLATFTMRGDGSSKFAPGHRWGYFPSLAFAWRIIQEGLMDEVYNVDNLKLRVSAGMLGNQNIGDYQYQALVYEGGAHNNYVFNGQLFTGAAYSSIGNTNLTWEKSTQLDVGLDYGLFGNRIAGSVDLYYKRSNDLLWQVTLPLESGYQSSLTNVGVLENKGLEFTINTININLPRFQWTTSLNFTYNKNNVVELYEGKTDFNKRIFVGHSLGEHYMLETNGLWQMDEAADAAIYGANPGDRKIVDQNDDRQINSDDRIFHGQSTPLYYGGMTNAFQFMGFDLVVFINYAGGHHVRNSLLRFLSSYNVNGNSSVEYYNNYWRENRPSNEYPAPRIGSSYLNGDGTDAILEDGSYIRIKNLELGYTLANHWLKALSAKNVRAFLSVQNLYTFTKYTGFDVEASSQSNPYPGSRAFVGGISVNF